MHPLSLQLLSPKSEVYASRNKKSQNRKLPAPHSITPHNIPRYTSPTKKKNQVKTNPAALEGDPKHPINRINPMRKKKAKNNRYPHAPEKGTQKKIKMKTQNVKEKDIALKQRSSEDQP